MAAPIPPQLLMMLPQLMGGGSGGSGMGGINPMLGALSGAATAGLPLLLREIALRPQLKRQREEHRELAAEVEAGRFGPSAAELQRRTAQQNEQLRQQMEMQRKAQERATAVGGSPADMARLQQSSARAQAQASLAGAMQQAQQARQEAQLEELTKRQQLADLDARREAFTNAAISQILNQAAQGAGVAGRRRAAQQMGIDGRASGFDPSILQFLMGMQQPSDAQIDAAIQFAPQPNYQGS